jgi:8-oxo-dGTP pyrophosphatase MutT (NUDIX family)
MASKPNKKSFTTSYGLVLFYIDSYDKIWYLIAQRRDTIEYTDFLRGRYSYPNLTSYFRLMTPSERERLQKYTFDELWDDLWLNHDSNYFREMRAKAHARYKTNFETMDKLLKTTVSFVSEPRWGFPKGRKNHGETDLECAFREFKEETRMSVDYLNLLNIPPSIETFKGSNGKMYSTVYYIARVNYKIPICKLKYHGQIRTETVSEEISNLMWGTFKDIFPKLPLWRQRLLVETDLKIKQHLWKEN